MGFQDVGLGYMLDKASEVWRSQPVMVLPVLVPSSSGDYDRMELVSAWVCALSVKLPADPKPALLH